MLWITVELGSDLKHKAELGHRVHRDQAGRQVRPELKELKA